MEWVRSEVKTIVLVRVSDSVPLITVAKLMLYWLEEMLNRADGRRDRLTDRRTYSL